MTTRIRDGLIAVLVLAVAANVLLIGDIVVGGGFLPTASASSAPAKPVAKAATPAPAKPGTAAPPRTVSPDPEVREAEAAYRALIGELTDQKAQLEKKAQELAERERQLGVLKQELAAQQAAAVEAKPAAAAAPAPAATENFKRLVKAYGGMEPDNAARALTELYERDPDVALDVLLGLSARRAAAVMDALASSKPSLAAEISSEITHRHEPRAE